jgi:voltage-gated potassium channel
MEYAPSPDRSSLRLRLIFLSCLTILLLLLGTLFYHIVEKWSYVDAFYFSAISLSTRGYGELHPTNAFSKIFTVFYLFLGVAFIIYTLSNLAGYYLQFHEPKIRKRMNTIVDRFNPPKKERWVNINIPQEKK